jgi:hypothetical protein
MDGPCFPDFEPITPSLPRISTARHAAVNTMDASPGRLKIEISHL